VLYKFCIVLTYLSENQSVTPKGADIIWKEKSREKLIYCKILHTQNEELPAVDKKRKILGIFDISYNKRQHRNKFITFVVLDKSAQPNPNQCLDQT